MPNPPSGTPEDDGTHHDLPALELDSTAEAEEPDLSLVLGGYSRPLESGTDDGTQHPDELAALMPDGADGDPAPDPLPVFTAANPNETVAVTTYLDGRVQRIDLAPGVTNMTEAVLADEIVCIAGLATQDARSAQYTVMLDGMREHGHDNAATRDFLSRDLDLPTPEQAAAARIELFTTRYAGEND
ncbi:MAG: hypothetical protein SW019_08895 [Actinomycetota bacterium]|nr:hypothetical protein [Actinomycetota bacterium]